MHDYTPQSISHQCVKGVKTRTKNIKNIHYLTNSEMFKNETTFDHLNIDNMHIPVWLLQVINGYNEFDKGFTVL